jgi:hypothetical protein
MSCVNTPLAKFLFSVSLCAKSKQFKKKIQKLLFQDIWQGILKLQFFSLVSAAEAGHKPWTLEW